MNKRSPIVIYFHRSYIFIFAAAAILWSCKSADKEALSDMDTLLASAINPKQFNTVLVIPSEGCGACITSAESLMIENCQKPGAKDILFIITGHNSIKSATVRFGQSVIKANNIFVDTAHIFDRPPFSEGYPMQLKLQNGRLVQYEEINPRNPLKKI